MITELSKGKEIKISGSDHPIATWPAKGTVRVTVAGRIVAESTRALRLEEKGYPPVYYLPRNDADMSLLVRTTHYTYCPYMHSPSKRLNALHCMGNERTAGTSGDYPTVAALKKVRLNPIFDFLELLTEGWFAHPQALGCLSHVALFMQGRQLQDRNLG